MEENDQEIPLSSNSNTEHQQPSQRSTRQKQDLAWTYVTHTLDSKGKTILTCDFCGKVNHGGVINRMKQHLAGVKRSTNGCTKVPPEVQHAMRKSLKENEEKAKQKRGVNMQLHDSIDKTEFWIVEEKGEGELDFFELEDKLLEEYPKDGEELSHGDED
uniref:BED-type domain-containing protein n=1 Tax=Brassica oleracea var. oleracea TaxID=109376 RepID=A0A0D3CCA4_BRAOL